MQSGRRVKAFGYTNDMNMMRRVQNQLHRVANKYPFVGPALWISSVQYFIVQVIVIGAWTTPHSWMNNYISDLGNTECGLYDGLYVCSPLHMLMNASFITFGISMALGAVLIYGQFVRTKWSLLTFALMVISGFGTILVGSFPENNPNGLHGVGAFLALGIGNVSIVTIGLALKGISPLFRAYTILSGTVSIVAFVLFLSDIYLGLGRGGMERLISYPFTVWMVSFGLYMTIVRMRSMR